MPPSFCSRSFQRVSPRSNPHDSVRRAAICGRWLAATVILALVAWPVAGAATSHLPASPPASLNLTALAVVYVDGTTCGATTGSGACQTIGYAVPDGTTLTWSTTLGTLNPASRATTGGVAQTSVSSTAAGAASVTASEPCGFTLSTTVSFVTGRHVYLPLLAR